MQKMWVFQEIDPYHNLLLQRFQYDYSIGIISDVRMYVNVNSKIQLIWIM